MSTGCSKGQGLVALVIMALGSVVLAAMITGLLVILQGPVEKKATIEIKHRTAETSFASASNLVMADYLWRSGDIQKGEYSGFEAYKVVSYYFSVDGGLKIDGDTIPRQEVKKDLKDYLRYKMENELGLRTSSYKIMIEDPESDRSIEVGKFDGVGREARITFPVAISNGGKVKVTMRREAQ